MSEATKWARVNANMLGFVFIAMGVFALLVPFVAAGSIVLLIGIAMATAGVFQAVMGFRAKVWGLAGVLGGVLHLAVGVLVLMHPLAGLAFLTILLAVFFFCDGVLRLSVALDLPKGTKGRGWLTFGGIVSGLLGVLMIAKWPAGAWVIGVFVGIELLWTGFGFLTIAREIRNMESAGEAPAES